jgi:hypothetical protein
MNSAKYGGTHLPSQKLRKLKNEDGKFKGNLGYTGRLVSKAKQNHCSSPTSLPIVPKRYNGGRQNLGTKCLHLESLLSSF